MTEAHQKPGSSEQAPPQPSLPIASESLTQGVVRKNRFQRVLSSGSLPLVLTSFLVIFCLIFAYLQLAPSLRWPSFSTPRVVSFDPVKFLNAQRAAASILATRPSADLALSMTQVASQAEAVIREEAQGALVLIKQSLVLADDIPDITDSVLRRFGLSTQVPTISTMNFDENALETYAPTNNAFSSERFFEDKKIEYVEQGSSIEAQLDKLVEQRNLLP